jgi:hypothetical protein
MAFMCNQGILPGEIAFCETEVMNGIEQVGLSDPIPPANAHDPFAETEFPGKIVFELNE